MGRDGNIIDPIPLHIGSQCFSHFRRILPTLVGIRIDGLHDDLGQFIVRIPGRGKGLFRRLLLEGKASFVVDLIQDHTDRIGIHGQIQGRHGIKNLRGRVDAAVFVRKGRIAQGVQVHEAQVSDAVLLLIGNKHIGRLQVHIEGIGLPADIQRSTKIQTQIDCFQMGHRIFPNIFVQRTLVSTHQIKLKTKAPAGNGLHLPAFVGQKAVQLGELLKKLRFLHHILTNALVIGHCIGRIFIGTGQQKGVQLHLGSRNGNDLDYVFFVGVFLYGGMTADAVMVTYGVTKGESVQQRGDAFLLRQVYRLL